jgi:hypothetical protein
VAIKLLGADDAADSSVSGANYFYLTKFTAEASGSMTEFRVKSSASGNAKVAIYADNAGEPGALITAMNTGQAVSGGGWETLSFTSTPITSGTVYWLAFCMDTNYAIGMNSAGGTLRYKAGTYSTFTFPNPAGTGFSSLAYFGITAGWGGREFTASLTLGLSLSVDRDIAIQKSSTKALGLALSAARVWGRERSASLAVGLGLSVDRDVAYQRAVGGTFTETLRPNAAGSETSISYQYPASGSHYDKVDDITPDEGSTEVYTYSSSYQRDLYNLPASSGSGTINYIKVYFRGDRAPQGPGYAKPAIKSNSTVTDGTEVALTTACVTYSQQWNTNPADGEAWEWSDIDALEIGVSLKDASGGYGAYCTQVYVEVNYITSVLPLGLSLSASRTVTYARSITTPLGLALTAARVWGREKTASLALGLNLSVSKAVTFARSLTKSLGLALSVDRDATYARSATKALGLALTVSRIHGIIKSASLTLGLALSVSRAVTYVRSVTKALGLALTASRAVTYGRSATKALGLALTASRAVTYARSASKAIGLVLTASRIHGIIKSATLTLGLKLTVLAPIIYKTRNLYMRITTSQYRQIKTMASQYRAIKAVTSMYRQIKTFMFGS